MINNWEDWIKFLKGVYKCTLTKEQDMAKKCLETLKDPKLRCELEFLVGFGKAFVNNFFAWLHRVDEHSKLSGFSSHEVVLRIAIMERDLKNIRVN